MPRLLSVCASFGVVLSFAFSSLPAAAEEVRTTGPHRAMLHSGAWTLGLAYVPALIVAIESRLPSDEYLYIPVAGPWLDLADRGCPACDHETLYRVLLVTDGIFQGIGALTIAGSFLFTETRVTSATAAPPPRVAMLRVAPARIRGGFGLALAGDF